MWVLYESDGLYGKSHIKKIDVKTGKIFEIYHLPEDRFAEGCTIFKNKLYLLTWKSR